MPRRLAHTAKPRTVITMFTIGLPVIMLLIGLLLAQQNIQNEATSQAVTHSTVVRARLQRVFVLLQDAETGERGYMLTGQDKYLGPYTEAVAQINPQMAKLTDAVKSEPAQLVLVRRLQGIVARKLHGLAQNVGLVRKGDQADALKYMATGLGFALMNQARDITATIQTVEVREAAVQSATRRAGRARTVWFGAALLAALVLLIGFSAVMAFLNYRAGEKVIADVRHLTDQLQSEKARLLQTVRELNAARMSADNANRAKSEFLASMSHELRTPLNAILGFSEIIKDEMFGPVGLHQYVDYASDVHKSGQHLLDLINDVLDLSKIQAGKVELREEEVDLSQLVLDSISLTRERASKGGVGLLFHEKRRGPLVVADRRLIKQILLNLLSNAIKFTPTGGTVSVRTFADGKGMGIAIQDTGIGMNADDIVTAMSLYGQVDSKVSRKHKGTGLGLPISQSLARLHGGDLVVESAPGQGTTITLILPFERAVTPELAKAS